MFACFHGHHSPIGVDSAKKIRSGQSPSQRLAAVDAAEAESVLAERTHRVIEADASFTAGQLTAATFQESAATDAGTKEVERGASFALQAGHA